MCVVNFSFGEGMYFPVRRVLRGIHMCRNFSCVSWTFLSEKACIFPCVVCFGLFICVGNFPVCRELSSRRRYTFCCVSCSSGYSSVWWVFLCFVNYPSGEGECLVRGDTWIHHDSETVIETDLPAQTWQVRRRITPLLFSTSVKRHTFPHKRGRYDAV